MEQYLRFSQRLIDRLNGPLNMRFVLQPTIAIALGIRDGLHDARVGTPSLLCFLFSSQPGRRLHFQEALKRLLLPITVATVLDGVVQYLLFHEVRVLGAVIIGVLIMGVPYLLARELTNRIVSCGRRRRSAPVTDGPSRDLHGTPPG